MNHFTATSVLSQDASEAAQAEAQLNAEAQEHFFDPEWRRGMIQALTTTIYEGFEHETLLGMLADVENVDEGERIIMEEISGLEVFWTSNGGNIQQSSLTEESWELKRDYVGFHVSELIEKVQANFTKYYKAWGSLAISQIDAAINSRLLRLYEAVIHSGSPYYVGSAGVSLPAINTAITEVQDETKFGEVTIIGRATMVNQIFDELQADNNFAPETNEALIRLGSVGTYRGAKIVRLINHKDRNGDPFVPGNTLFVAGKDAAKVGFWGGLRSQEWQEPGGWYTHLMGRRSAGFAIAKPENVRRIVDTSM